MVPEPMDPSKEQTSGKSRVFIYDYQRKELSTE